MYNTRRGTLVPCIVLLRTRPNVAVVPSGPTRRWPRCGVLRRPRLGLIVARWLPWPGVWRVVPLSRSEVAFLVIVVIVAIWGRLASTRL